MSSTAELIDGFEQLVTSHAKRGTASKESLMAGIAKARGILPEDDSETSWEECKNRREKARAALIREYAASLMAEAYPLLSPDLFKMRRHLTVSVNNHKATLTRDDTMREDEQPTRKGNTHFRYATVALFASVEFFGTGRRSVELEQVSVKEIGYSLRATLPGVITEPLRRKAYAAVSHFYRVFSELVAEPVVAEYVLHAYDFERKPKVRAIWIPSPDALSVEIAPMPLPKSKDPAIVIDAYGQSFLVGTWIAEGEDPFENILREFSSGSLKGVLE